MPAVSRKDLRRAIIDAFEQSGYGAAPVRPLRNHPLRFLVRTGTSTVEVWIYIWTLTFGGRRTLPNEYRIQMTSVAPPLDVNPAGFTLLMGYEPGSSNFAGFDFDLHRSSFAPGSASVQVGIDTIRSAQQDGLAFSRKTNDEVVVGIRPDQFMAYVENAKALHRYGKHASVHKLLERARSLQDIPSERVGTLSEPRRRLVSEIGRLSQDRNFRKTVMHAYDNRCAVSGVQLNLVEAAHILPVHAPNSPDIVRNGIALSPTYHRAYDRRLIYLDRDYRMNIDSGKIQELASLNLTDGLRDFERPLNKRVFLPQDRNQWPDPVLINRANKFRDSIDRL